MYTMSKDNGLKSGSTLKRFLETIGSLHINKKDYRSDIRSDSTKRWGIKRATTLCRRPIWSSIVDRSPCTVGWCCMDSGSIALYQFEESISTRASADWVLPNCHRRSKLQASRCYYSIWILLMEAWRLGGQLAEVRRPPLLEVFD
jgi:hypothetical protein